MEAVEERAETQTEEASEESEETSLEELAAKSAEKREPPEESDDESMLSLDREDRVGTLPAKVAPQQETEFTCKKCFLVKHRSQLADKRRMICKDCK